MKYNPVQLDREIHLALTEAAVLADQIAGPGAGLRLLDLDETSEFAQSGHPDELPATSAFLIGQQADRLQRYVHQQRWYAGIRDDISGLRITLERVFPPSILDAYETERLAEPEHASADGDVLGPFEPGAGDVPLGFFYRGLLSELVAVASARLKVDEGEPLTMGELALLTDKRDATIATTAYRKVFPTFEISGKRYAEVADVLPWLEANGYQPTQHKDITTPQQAERPLEEAYLFVPVAKDGSLFAPSCAVAGRFTIGERGSEQKFESFHDALDALQRMNTPRWRRKGPKGVPGIVTGVRFERVTRHQIEMA